MYTNFIQSEHENIKVFKYADYMAIAGLFDLKTDSIFFVAIERTKEMVVSFSRTFAIYDYLFIDRRSIEKV